MAFEYTLALIKSGAHQRWDTNRIVNVITRREFFNFGITISRELTIKDIPVLKDLYAEHRGRPYYDALMESVMKGGSALVINGDNAVARWRRLMGPPDPVKARDEAPESIRGLFGGKEMPDNAVHGSDSAEAARREIKLFFPECTKLWSV